MGSVVGTVVDGKVDGLAATLVGVGVKRAVTVGVEVGVNETLVSGADSELSHATASAAAATKITSADFRNSLIHLDPVEQLNLNFSARLDRANAKKQR